MEETKFISEQRRRLGITQQRLAKMAGVSQSLIAKIEAGRVDAAYSKVKAIIEALERVQLAGERKASDIMHQGVDSVSPEDTLHSAAILMRKKAISQLPVVERGASVGSLTEAAMLSFFTSGKRIEGVLVREAMGEAFPNVLPSTPISAVAPLLRHHCAALVLEKGRIAGIITKADILKSV